jgi:hypothetical protein
LKSIWCPPWGKSRVGNKRLPPRSRTGKLPFQRTATVNTASLTHDFLAVQPSVTFNLGADLSILSVYYKEDFSYKANVTWRFTAHSPKHKWRQLKWQDLTTGMTQCDSFQRVIFNCNMQKTREIRDKSATEVQGDSEYRNQPTRCLHLLKSVLNLTSTFKFGCFIVQHVKMHNESVYQQCARLEWVDI